jgi:toxin ParE1/3/4
VKALVFSPAAEADIEAIWEYSADNWGEDQADRYTDEIRECCDGLTSGRKRGRLVNVRRGYFVCQAGSHMIYFRDHGDVLEVVRVLHGAQDVQRHL